MRGQFLDDLPSFAAADQGGHAIVVAAADERDVVALRAQVAHVGVGRQIRPGDMPDMQPAVGVGQSRRDKKSSAHENASYKQRPVADLGGTGILPVFQQRQSVLLILGWEKRGRARQPQRKSARPQAGPGIIIEKRRVRTRKFMPLLTLTVILLSTTQWHLHSVQSSTSGCPSTRRGAS